MGSSQKGPSLGDKSSDFWELFLLLPNLKDRGEQCLPGVLSKCMSVLLEYLKAP